jgi:hypothetical protein
VSNCVSAHSCSAQSWVAPSKTANRSVWRYIFASSIPIIKMAIFNFNMFNSIDFSPAGLFLNYCSCTGSSKIYIPKDKIDHITSGREFYPFTFLSGLSILVFGGFLSSDARREAQFFYLAGSILLITAFALSFLQTLRIISCNGTFVSMKLCNQALYEPLMNWLHSTENYTNEISHRNHSNGSFPLLGN